MVAAIGWQLALAELEAGKFGVGSAVGTWLEVVLSLMQVFSDARLVYAFSFESNSEFASPCASPSCHSGTTWQASTWRTSTCNRAA